MTGTEEEMGRSPGQMCGGSVTDSVCCWAKGLVFILDVVSQGGSQGFFRWREGICPYIFTS